MTHVSLLPRRDKDGPLCEFGLLDIVVSASEGGGEYGLPQG
jgi:hypothetical protein